MSAKIMRQLLAEHWGKVLGGLTGLFIGLSIITFGLWRSLLLFLFIALGVFLGKRYDRHEGLQKVRQRIWPDSD
ncbi:hypothetical protein HKBW3S42_00729 [Candidatus Hakubella thermalkaliphila]|uniref:DUF2273 domain-containing protein n=1 Tax=Candidatus Hakubella thermalkaliphila TaxID=2754717 RepID=A0A6V8QEB7_9ACTN|nr:DUF2273 domain-containing protein [Candidatus Hakubella thermalkaliphila]GFP31354.1 hypothetical protein HKBW3S34_02274 [Candidatus Hakubella thermalkaliphila]GFP32424.1 hypothetical protein HKBW3S42_00729 [Candidatus Hakubella thermalkaliphila]GFP43108.1 hypothetical protein HKBW3C_02239 [Candidatus Hakubella thermalkaliphila]